jgi:tRNA (guanine37-N1)-methyltransferase
VRIDIVTIFPEYLAPLGLSLLGRARQAGRVDLRVHDLRAYAEDRHRTVDDTPYGGGAGMVMTPEPWGRALDELLSGAEPEATSPRLVVPTPSGRRFDQQLAAELAAEPWLVFACGRYEGIDRRFVEDAGQRVRVDEVSVGDYVLAGGESATIVVVEAVTRLLPGVLGNAESLAEESHAEGLLEYPVYTKPARWRGHDVPQILLGGNHRAVAAWRRAASLRRTAAVRPDLLVALDPAGLVDADRELLDELGWSVGPDGRFSPPG